MPGRVHNQIALVTGAASGIGRETALLLAHEGAKVVVADIDGSRAQATSSEIRHNGGESISVSLDVAAEEAWNSSLELVRKTWRELDILINCAGVSDETPITELSYALWRRVLSINLDGVYLGTTAAIRSMRAAGHGSIVNVSSVSGIRASAGASAYCASKAAVIQFSKTVALECAQADMNIRVNCVLPGGVKTPMWETTSLWPQIAATDEWLASPDTTPLKRFAQPMEVARAILFLASDEASYITGTALAIDGGYTA